MKVESLEDRRVLAFVVPPVNYDAGANPQAIVSADFNGGGLDLAVANYNDSTVTVLLGDGVGGFGAKTDFATGSYPLSLAVGDFDDDGNLDLATANAYDVSVLLGDGHGSFGAATSIGVAGNPQSMAVGDFNGDGTLDLGVTSNYYNPGYSGWYGWYPGYNTGYANVLLGNGDGTFSGPNVTYIDSYASANSALVADLNGDTYDDFVAFDSYGYVAVLLGDSSGYLQGPTSYIYTGDFSYAVAAGDVDGDGTADLVTANYNGNSVGVLLGTGSGTFGSASIYAAGSQPRSVAMANFNGDSIIDLVTANVDNGTISVLLGTGTGFTLPVTSTVGSSPVGLAVGDFNGTGGADVASANSGSDNVSVLLNNGIWPALNAPSLTLSNASVAEGQTGTTEMVFNVTLSAAPTQTVTVHYATADYSTVAGDDYVAAEGTLTFSPGDPLTKNISVTINGDRVVENGEFFYLRLSDATNAFLARATGAGNIIDDEPRVSIDYGPVSVTEGNTGTTNAGFKVRLAAPYDVPVNVIFSTAEGDTDYPGYYNPATSGSDFQAASSVDVTFAPNETEKTILIAVNGDRLVEYDEYFSVNLDTTEFGTIVEQHAVGIILDDEPRLSINSPSITEGNSGTKQLTFTVTLSAAYDQAVTVNYATRDGSATSGSDYVAITTPLTLTFNPGDPLTKTITVTIKGDKQKENNEYFYVDLSGASSNALISNSYGIGTILTDDHGNGPPPGKGPNK